MVVFEIAVTKGGLFERRNEADAFIRFIYYFMDIVLQLPPDGNTRISHKEASGLPRAGGRDGGGIGQ